MGKENTKFVLSPLLKTTLMTSNADECLVTL